MKKLVCKRRYRSQNGYYQDTLFEKFRENIESHEESEFFGRFGNILGYDDGASEMLAVFNIDGITLAYLFGLEDETSYITLSLCGKKERVEGIEKLVIKAFDKARKEVNNKNGNESRMK